VLASLSRCCTMDEVLPIFNAESTPHTIVVLKPRSIPRNFTITNGCEYNLPAPQYGKQFTDRPADGYTVALLYLPSDLYPYTPNSHSYGCKFSRNLVLRENFRTFSQIVNITDNLETSVDLDDVLLSTISHENKRCVKADRK